MSEHSSQLRKFGSTPKLTVASGFHQSAVKLKADAQ